MESGLLDMCVGEKRHLIIPPHLAYGERGVSKFSPYGLCGLERPRKRDGTERERGAGLGCCCTLTVSIRLSVLFAPAAGEVPGSAVLVFDVELINVEEGLPEGYMFIWNEDVSSDLFSEMDKDGNKLVEPSEVRPDLAAVEEN